MADERQTPQHLPHSHPYLVEPKLYISNLSPDVTDADLAVAFEACIPIRPRINRTNFIGTLQGEIDFKYLISAEKALATLQGRALDPHYPNLHAILSPYPPTQPSQGLPVPVPQPRLIKQLPSGTTDAYLFDLFRPYGSIASVLSHSNFGPDVGIVQFWEEDDARIAESELHCSNIAGNTISVQAYQPRRAGTNAAAAPFIPSGYPPVFSSPGAPSGRLPYVGINPPVSPSTVNSSTPPFHHGPGQQVQFAPRGGPASGSHSGLVDPCNLFCKNLDSSIDSNDLFNYFKPFGHIVSARVMRGDSGESRGFGFVSYQAPEQAARALGAMNGQIINGKQIQVRFHEPKQLRQEKLAQRFSVGGSRRASGSSSPALSDGAAEHPALTSERPRRGSGSYYNAALSGNTKLTWDFDELQSLTSVVRNEVLKGELSRRVQGLHAVPFIHLDAVVNKLLTMSLTQIVQGLHDQSLFDDQVRTATQAAESEENSQVHSNPVVGLTGLSLNQSSETSNAFSVGSPQVRPVTPTSERDRLATAVSSLFDVSSNDVAAIVELLLSLPKRERALCLFNNEYLKSKVSDAKEVLAANDDGVNVSSNQSAPAGLERPTLSPRGNLSIKAISDPVLLRVASSQYDIKPARLGFPDTHTSDSYSFKSLAVLSAKEIIQIIESRSDLVDELGLTYPDPQVVRATDDLVDSVMGKPAPQQKQILGKNLFNVIRAFGVKGAPKVTITLLDSEDLRALSHLMNSYPNILKEKVLSIVAAT